MNLTLQTIPSGVISEILSNSALDGVVLDTEHGCFNDESLYNCIQIITLSQKKCFVRLTDFNKKLIRLSLDAGADGLVFSTIDDKLESRKIYSYCNYPKFDGIRGCGLVRENKWGKDLLGDKKPILIAQIETIQAVDNLESLLKVPFDFYLVGPYDLSSSLLRPGQFDDKLFINSLNKIFETIPQSQSGIFLPTKQFFDLPYKPAFIIWGLDTNFLINSIGQLDL